MTASNLDTRKTSEGASLGADSFTSYSLNFEDVILHRLFPVKPSGFYVDVGAGHPRFENDTFSLYQRGWSGINVEPNHGFHAALLEERPRDVNLRVVLSDSSGGSLTYYELNESGLSTCDVEQATVYQAAGRDVVVREVPVTTLSHILADAGIGHIDILKVDVEGFEEKVLDGNDWVRFRPDVVVVEATYPENPARRPTGISTSMEQRGYRHVHFDGLNDFYLKLEFEAPDGLTLPPNVFDRFVPREIADLRIQAESLRIQLESQQVKIKAAEEFAGALKVQTADQVESLQIQVESLQVKIKAAEEYAGALKVQTANLASENRRMLRGGEQMRAELLVLNQLLEPLHAMTEQLEQQKEKLGASKAEATASSARLVSVYSSLSWRLTAPLRWCDGIRRRIAQRKRIGGGN